MFFFFVYILFEWKNLGAGTKVIPGMSIVLRKPPIVCDFVRQKNMPWLCIWLIWQHLWIDKTQNWALWLCKTDILPKQQRRGGGASEFPRNTLVRLTLTTAMFQYGHAVFRCKLNCCCCSRGRSKPWPKWAFIAMITGQYKRPGQVRRQFNGHDQYWSCCYRLYNVTAQLLFLPI